MNEDLQRFVRQARERGMDFASIRVLLSTAGWKDKQIVEAFSSGEPGLSVPEPPNVGSARDTFLHLLAFTALYTWLVTLVLLWFAYIDIAFPDAAWQASDAMRETMQSGIRVGLAAIVVAFPAFLLIWSYLLREIRRYPEKARSAVRRWLIWLSLFVGAVTLSVDVITLVYFLFEGQLSIRFLVKVVALFLVAGTGVAYLTVTMRPAPEPAA